MAAPTLWLYNKYGYCKFSERCRKHHINDIYENSSCMISDCGQSHPKICRYLENFGNCKFIPCAFKHESKYSEPANGQITMREN